MPEVSIKLTGNKQWDEYLRDSSNRSENLKPAYERLSSDIFKFFKKRFDTSGRYGGKPWQRKAPATIQNSRSTKPLINTRRLERSFTKRGGDNLLRATDDSLEVGSRLDYAAYHQAGFRQKTVFGTLRKNPITVPPRPILPQRVPQRDGQNWGGQLMEYITTGTN